MIDDRCQTYSIPAGHSHSERQRRISVLVDGDSLAGKYRSAGRYQTIGWQTSDGRRMYSRPQEGGRRCRGRLYRKVMFASLRGRSSAFRCYCLADGILEYKGGRRLTAPGYKPPPAAIKLRRSRHLNPLNSLNLLNLLNPVHGVDPWRYHNHSIQPFYTTCRRQAAITLARTAGVNLSL